MNPTPEQIKAARACAGLTQAEAAAMLPVTRESWARWEIGAAPMPVYCWRLWRHLAGIERIRFRRGRVTECKNEEADTVPWPA